MHRLYCFTSKFSVAPSRCLFQHPPEKPEVAPPPSKGVEDKPSTEQAAKTAVDTAKRQLVRLAVSVEDERAKTIVFSKVRAWLSRGGLSTGSAIGSEVFEGTDDPARVDTKNGMAYVRAPGVGRAFDYDKEFFCPFQITVEGNLIAPDGKIINAESSTSDPELKKFDAKVLREYAKEWEKRVTEEKIAPIKDIIEAEFAKLRDKGYRITGHFGTYYDGQFQYKIFAKKKGSEGKKSFSRWRHGQFEDVKAGWYLNVVIAPMKDGRVRITRIPRVNEPPNDFAISDMIGEDFPAKEIVPLKKSQ